MNPQSGFSHAIGIANRLACLVTTYLTTSDRPTDRPRLTAIDASSKSEHPIVWTPQAVSILQTGLSLRKKGTLPASSLIRRTDIVFDFLIRRDPQKRFSIRSSSLIQNRTSCLLCNTTCVRQQKLQKAILANPF